MANIPCDFPSEASPKGAPMSEEEAEYWDDLFTRTTPKLASGKGGFFTERQQQMVLLDEKIVRYINAKAHASGTQFPHSLPVARYAFPGEVHMETIVPSWSH
ncbi:hypothetical protein AGMMS50293_20480 [Spirochaetia bacterium]|nr:hypothetical protein AGMMS50293_20480 [Spirochaetia bacterium]